MKPSVGSIERSLYLGKRIWSRLFTILLSSQFAQFGRGSRISPPFRFGSLNQISIGDDVYIARDCWIIAFNDPDHEDGHNHVKLTLKSRVKVGMGSTLSAARQVVLNENVLLGRNVNISDYTHNYEDPAMPIQLQGHKAAQPVSIGRDAWLGQNVVVLPGVTIGEHCVIGANSVVNRSVPDFSIAVGAPARVVRKFNRETNAWEKCH